MKKQYFSDYLKEFIEKRNLKMEYIAEITNSSKGAISHYKKGIRIPNDDFIDKFINAFNLTEKEKELVLWSVAMDKTPELIKKELTYNIKDNNLGLLIKKFRMSRELTVMELAIKAGVGNGTVGNIERGANKATTKTLEKLAHALDLNDTERAELFACLVPKDIQNKIEKGTENINSKALELYDIFFRELSSEDTKDLLHATLKEFKLFAIEKNKYNEYQDKFNKLENLIKTTKK